MNESSEQTFKKPPANCNSTVASSRYNIKKDLNKICESLNTEEDNQNCLEQVNYISQLDKKWENNKKPGKAKTKKHKTKKSKMQHRGITTTKNHSKEKSRRCHLIHIRMRLRQTGRWFIGKANKKKHKTKNKGKKVIDFLLKKLSTTSIRRIITTKFNNNRDNILFGDSKTIINAIKTKLNFNLYKVQSKEEHQFSAILKKIKVSLKNFREKTGRKHFKKYYEKQYKIYLKARKEFFIKNLKDKFQKIYDKYSEDLKIFFEPKVDSEIKEFIIYQTLQENFESVFIDSTLIFNQELENFEKELVRAEILEK